MPPKLTTAERFRQMALADELAEEAAWVKRVQKAKERSRVRAPARAPTARKKSDSAERRAAEKAEAEAEAELIADLRRASLEEKRASPEKAKTQPKKRGKTKKEKLEEMEARAWGRRADADEEEEYETRGAKETDEDYEQAHPEEAALDILEEKRAEAERGEAEAEAAAEGLCEAAEEEMEAGGIDATRWEELRKSLVPREFWDRVIDTSLDSTLDSFGVQSIDEIEDATTRDELVRLDAMQKPAAFRKRLAQWYDDSRPASVFDQQVADALRQIAALELNVVDPRRGPDADVAAADVDDIEDYGSWDAETASAATTSSRRTMTARERERVTRAAIRGVARGERGRHMATEEEPEQETRIVAAAVPEAERVTSPENYPVLERARRIALQLLLGIIRGHGGLTPFQVSQLYHCQSIDLVNRVLAWIAGWLKEFDNNVRDAENAKPGDILAMKMWMRNQADFDKRYPKDPTDAEAKEELINQTALKAHDTFEEMAIAADNLAKSHGRDVGDTELEFRARDIRTWWERAVANAIAHKPLEDVEDLLDRGAFLSVEQMAPRRHRLPLRSETNENEFVAAEENVDTPLHTVLDNTTLNSEQIRALQARAIAEGKPADEYVNWFREKRRGIWAAMTAYRYYPDWLQEAATKTKMALEELPKNASLKEKREYAYTPLVEALAKHWYDFWTYIDPALGENEDVAEMQVRWLTDNFMKSAEVAKFMLSRDDAVQIVNDVRDFVTGANKKLLNDYRGIELQENEEQRETLRREMAAEVALKEKILSTANERRIAKSAKDLKRINKELARLQKELDALAERKSEIHQETEINKFDDVVRRRVDLAEALRREKDAEAQRLVAPPVQQLQILTGGSASINQRPRMPFPHRPPSRIAGGYLPSFPPFVYRPRVPLYFARF